MTDEQLIVKGWRKCSAYCCIAGVMNLALCFIPSWHINAGLGIGMLSFGVASYVLSRLGVVP